MNQLIQGDCLEKMKDLPDNSVDSIVTDPPYGLSFMGKDWDRGVPGVHFWQEMIRVLKPGGHLLSFSGTRTYHRMACAIEDAGFEIRDMIEWIYGSGFPKSLNIGKAVDKLQGNEREVVGEYQRPDGSNPRKAKQGYQKEYVSSNSETCKMEGESKVTKGTSEWEGWGTALKPAHEPICMARKPLAEKTVAENCLKWGTGGINIDESRVGTEERYNAPAGNKAGGNSLNMSAVGMPQDVDGTTATGRFPANLIHDNSEEVRDCFPESKTQHIEKPSDCSVDGQTSFQSMRGNRPARGYDGEGNASRFFKSIIYQAKASKSERNKGCEGLEEKVSGHRSNFRCKICGYQKASGTPCKCENPVWEEIPLKPQSNNHPTVKPIALMEYLINMITPKGGLVLDPFMGSGTTGVACKNLNRSFIGIELDEGYFNIAKHRIEGVQNLF